MSLSAGEHRHRSLFRRGRHSRSRRQGRWLLVGAILCIAAAVIVAGRIAIFYLRSDIEGGRLVAAASKAEHSPVTANGQCSSLPDHVAGLLEAPSIGLVAPVLQGTSNPVLDVAVGHNPASSWPGATGTAVFAAHDVTWFSGLDHLAIGATVRWVTSCTTSIFRVVRTAVVHTGYPVHETTSGRIVLVTCYPVNALYLTPDRFLVYADYVTEERTQTKWVTAPLPSASVPTVPAPPALAAQGLGLTTNDAPLGVLQLSGTPNNHWAESAAPINDERAALHEYFGLLRAASQQQPTWWSALAPNLPTTSAGPLWGGTVTTYQHALDIDLLVNGTQLTGARFTTVVGITNNGTTADDAVTITEAVEHGTFYVTNVLIRA